jgi:hypothetical protein
VSVGDLPVRECAGKHGDRANIHNGVPEGRGYRRGGMRDQRQPALHFWRRTIKISLSRGNFGPLPSRLHQTASRKTPVQSILCMGARMPFASRNSSTALFHWGGDTFSESPDSIVPPYVKVFTKYFLSSAVDIGDVSADVLSFWVAFFVPPIMAQLGVPPDCKTPGLGHSLSPGQPSLLGLAVESFVRLTAVQAGLKLILVLRIRVSLPSLSAELHCMQELRVDGCGAGKYRN